MIQTIIWWFARDVNYWKYKQNQRINVQISLPVAPETTWWSSTPCCWGPTEKNKSQTLCWSTHKCFPCICGTYAAPTQYVSIFESLDPLNYIFCRAENFSHTVSSWIFNYLQMYVTGFICIHKESFFSLFHHLYIFGALLYTYIAEFPKEELAGPSPLVLGLEDLLRHVQDPLDALSVLVLLLPAHLDILHQHVVRHFVLRTTCLC